MSRTFTELPKSLLRPGLAALALFVTASAAYGAGRADDPASDLVFAGGDFRQLMVSVFDGQRRARSAFAQQVVDFDQDRDQALKRLDPDRHHDNQVVIRDTALSPDGRRIAIQVDHGVRPTTWVMAAGDGRGETLRRLTPKGTGFFLAWHPDGQQILFKALDLDVADPGLWLVRADSGEHRHVELPGLRYIEGLLAAAFSPDGGELAYAFSHGMGTGSEIWLIELESGALQRLHRQDHGIVASLRWSGDSEHLAFNTLFDSPVPFAEAGLWIYDRGLGKSRWLGLMDGGHGEQPVWSDDGDSLFFIARDNPEDAAADVDASALVSSLRAIHLPTGRESILVEAAGSRQIDLARGAAGALLFVSNRGGTALEVWSFDPAGKAGAVQLTSDGLPKRHPVSSIAGR